jgi:hypothetical protein
MELCQNESDASNLYRCECCDYKTDNKYHYKTHQTSKRHLKRIQENERKLQPNQCFLCNRILSSSKNLWRHKQTCKGASSANENTDLLDEEEEQQQNEREPSLGISPKTIINEDLVLELLKNNKEIQQVMIQQQKEVQSFMMEIMKNGIGGGNNTNSNNNAYIYNNNNNNNNNKTFNIQFFLNEYCKNAIDINDFVKSLDYSTENLEENMKLGYVGGISKLMTDKIKVTPIDKRPMHCCDEKREKIYIKNKGEWITGSDSKEKLQQIIADIANNNYRTFQKWVHENPSCVILDTPAYEKYMNIYKGVIGSRSDEEEIKHVKKILNNILEDIVIEKEKYLI